MFPPVADERSLLREVELLVTIPLEPALAGLNGIPSHFRELAGLVEERFA